MIDMRSQRRSREALAKTAADTATTAFAAYADMTTRSLELWTTMFKAWSACWPEPGRMSTRASSALPSPFAFWTSMLQSSRMMGPYPIAGAMMAAGMPSEAAWPAARAGVAAIDAAAVATRAVDRAFSSYRSSGGHATAQIVIAPPVAQFAALATPLSMWPLTPWSKVWGSAG